MKVLYIFGVVFGLLVVACAAPAKLDQVNLIARLANDDRSYHYDIESEKPVGPKPEDIGPISRGSYSYVSPEGVVFTVNWVADENGFQATDDHLPTPPPMPEP